MLVKAEFYVDKDTLKSVVAEELGLSEEEIEKENIELTVSLEMKWLEASGIILKDLKVEEECFS